MDLILNPWGAWKQAYDAWEKTYSDSIQNQMQEESFAAWMGTCQQWFLFYQDYHNKTMEQWLQSAKIPSKADLAQVSSLVIQVEEKMELLEDKLEDEILAELQHIRKALAALKSQT